MPYFDGLQIKDALNMTTGADVSDASEYLASHLGVEITWFEVSSDYLKGDGTLTPSEILQLHFGGDLSSPTDGESGRLIDELISDLTDGGTIPLPLTGDTPILDWRGSLTIAYMVTAVIGSLPPITPAAVEDQVTGFLDSTKSWGLVYDVDIQYKNMDNTTAGLLAFGMTDTGAPLTTAQRLAAATESLSTDWHLAANDSAAVGGSNVWNSVYPAQAYKDITGRGGGLGWHSLAGAPVDIGTPTFKGNLASTYAIEALGFDAFDATSGPGPIDAGEFLHSNEVFRVPPELASGEGYENDPTRITTGLVEDGTVQLTTWQYSPETRQILAGAYHAKKQTSDAFTVVHADAPWRKTHNQEAQDIISAIDDACALIGPEVETVTFPKRLINHVQRRKKIPNNMVSAFGYVPGEMYTAGTADVYASDASDRDSYEPVTGEMSGFTIDNEGEITYSSLPPTDPTSTVPGGYGTRGAEEGWVDDEGAGEEDTDGDGFRPDWWYDD